jgi:transcriptional regulatory protein RtcR
MKRIIIGFLGSTHDKRKENKPDKDGWRPTITLFKSDQIKFDQLELIHQNKPDHSISANEVKEDIEKQSPDVKVNLHQIELKNPRKFDETYLSLFDFAKKYNFAPDNNEYFVHITTGTHIAQICLFLLTESRYFPAKLVQTSRTTRGEESIIDVIDLELKTYNLIAKRFDEDKKDQANKLKDNIKTKNERFNKIIDEIQAVAINSKDPILLSGDTGTGKSKLANLIYESKKDNKQLAGKFVDVNCATIRGENAMSALFGHNKNSFTGVAARKGFLQEAENGLLFLDEIGELGLEEQAMLLKAIEEKKFRRHGSDDEISVEFQFIAGTNKDLYSMVCEGRFREDLLNRIDHWEYQLPCLRDRPEDIEPNIYFEIDKREKAVNFTGKSLKLFLDFAESPEALWLGNFRDFTRSINRMITISGKKWITDSDVKNEIERLKEKWEKLSPTSKIDNLDEWISKTIKKSRDPFEMFQLKGVIEVCCQSNSLADAGKKLFSVSSKKLKKPNYSDRLRKYLLKFGLNWDLLQTIPK